MQRSKELDNIKTALVVVMLLYHSASCLNIWPKYLDVLYFIHYAFILMTGVVVGFHYLSTERINVLQKGFRLIFRGVKLLGIFFLCNAIFYLANLYSWSALVEYYHNGLVQFLCNPKGSLCAFEILYHIALFLIVAPVCLVPYGMQVGGIFGICLILQRENQLGFCIGFGFLGVLLGKLFQYLLMERQDILKTICQWGFASIFLLIPLHWIGPWHQFGIILFGEILLWLLFCMSAMQYAHLPKLFDILGKYTLLAYIFHVSLLSIFTGAARHLHMPLISTYFLLLVLASGGTLVFLLTVDRLRRKILFCDRLYKLIFS